MRFLLFGLGLARLKNTDYDIKVLVQDGMVFALVCVKITKVVNYSNDILLFYFLIFIYVLML